MGSRISAVHDGLVGPLEIKRLDQGFAHARVSEFFATGIDKPALRTRGSFVRQCLAPDTAVLGGGKIIARRPPPRGELFAKQIVLRGEALERDIAVAIKFVAHRIEIEAAARNRKIGTPPIFDAFELDVAVDLE